jgi:hypothetical protein
MKIKVRNMKSSRGNNVPNQFLIDKDTGKYSSTTFQSYQTLIARKIWTTGKTILDKNSWDYSVTTGRYRNQFLGEGIAETKKKINSGEYRLVNLN